ncbi:hypothetical protein GPROT2_00007 [Gammaproteobacteria bacterium]|nr:MAG: FHA domain-containing protein [Gammaproteobacteria bacterium]CAG0937824.1 hypothetical protein GPROT2_00007 [Gammaproteobacteria bacterium]
MATAAVDLNDAALTLAAAGRVLWAEPGLAAATGALGRAAGEAAAPVSTRHWRDLDDGPLPRPLGSWRSSADIVQAQLLQLRAALPSGCEALVAAVPSSWSARQLGLLLGLARDAGLPLAGLVDSAVAASRRPAPGRELWHLELTLHDAGLTHIGQADGASRDTAQRLDWLSFQALDRACARAIGAALLRASRFDPFHDDGSERQLYAGLAGWLADLAGHESRRVSISYRGSEFAAEVSAAELRAAVTQAAERLLQRLRALAPPAAGAVLQVPDRLAGYPGLLESLAGLPGWEIVTLEPGAAALGALRLAPTAPSGALALATQLPWDRPPLPSHRDKGSVLAVVAAARPSHLCYGHRLLRLDGRPLRIGSQLADGEYGLQLPASLQGLSRRHCSLVLEAGRVLLHDHSRYGTRLNGVAVEGSAVLHAGDRIEIGQPPVELRLLAEEGVDAPAP